MTPEEFKEVLEKLDFSVESSGFPGSNLALYSTVRGASAFESAREFIRENGNSCRIISADENRQSYDCICFSVGEWLYFVAENDRVCLRRVSWNQVEFLDTDLIRLHTAGEGGEAQ